MMNDNWPTNGATRPDRQTRETLAAELAWDEGAPLPCRNSGASEAGDAVLQRAGDGRGLRVSLSEYRSPHDLHGTFNIGCVPPMPTVVWLTGLSGAGKSTIAEPLVSALVARGAAVESLDGDQIRNVFPSVGFTRSDRDAHVRRVGYLASRLEAHGVTVVAALVSPYREARAFVRGLCRRFVEVHVATPIEECERRDPKGLYRKARSGEVAHFTGIDDPYEPPEHPEITIDTREVSPAEAVLQILSVLEVDVAGSRAGRPWDRSTALARDARV